MVAWKQKSRLIALVIFLGKRRERYSCHAVRLHSSLINYKVTVFADCRRRVLITFITFTLGSPIAGNSSFLQMYIRGYSVFTFSTTTNQRRERTKKQREWMKDVQRERERARMKVMLFVNKQKNQNEKSIKRQSFVTSGTVHIFHVSTFISVRFFERRWTFVFHLFTFHCQELSFAHLKCSNSLSMELLHML